jgi:glycogen debranching enzyme
MRPTQAEYDRFMTLVQLYRAHGWWHEITRLSPFRVADVGTNCILLRADRDLLALAERFGEREAAAEIRTWIGRAESAFSAFTDPGTGLWHSLDQVEGARVPAATHAGFLAFWAGLGDARLAGLLERWLAEAPHGVASVRSSDPRFDRRRYWRGPVWLVCNFMLAEGLREAGFGDLAARIARDSRALVEAAGFFEYFDPLDGSGLGGTHFTWTAAMWLAWARVAGR